MSLLAKETLLMFCPKISNLFPMIMYSMPVPNRSIFEKVISVQISLIKSLEWKSFGGKKSVHIVISSRCIGIKIRA